ncbi:MAG: hypothetical protein EA422_00110, partial [Gemmatimonadales bacterium]
VRGAGGGGQEAGQSQGKEAVEHGLGDKGKEGGGRSAASQPFQEAMLRTTPPEDQFPQGCQFNRR